MDRSCAATIYPVLDKPRNSEALGPRGPLLKEICPHLVIEPAGQCTQKALGCRSFELFDIVDAADAVLDAIHGIGLDDYCNSRLIRSVVEREFINIGQALKNLSPLEPECTHRRRCSAAAAGPPAKRQPDGPLFP